MKNYLSKITTSIFIILIIFSCKTTKKVIDTSSTIGKEAQQSTQTTVTNNKITDELTETITETITEEVVEKNEVLKDNAGNKILSPVKTVKKTSSKTTELFTNKKEDKLITDNVDTIKQKDTVSVNSNYDRATEGQEVVSDITSGISKGFFKFIFGGFVQYIFIIIGGIFIFILIKKQINKSNK